MKNKRLLAALGALVLFIATAVYGDYNVLDKQSHYQNATSGAKTNVTGDAWIDDADRDRNFSTVQTIISSVTLNAGNAVQNNLSVKSLLQYGRGTLLVTWGTATAADSDSVNVAIKIDGKTSLTDANNYGFSGITADSTTPNVLGTPAVLSPTYYVTRNALLTLNSGGATRAHQIPVTCYRKGASTNGIAIPVGDNAGTVATFPYIMVTVSNLHPRKNLTAVQVDFWPRVN